MAFARAHARRARARPRTQVRVRCLCVRADFAARVWSSHWRHSGGCVGGRSPSDRRGDGASELPARAWARTRALTKFGRLAGGQCPGDDADAAPITWQRKSHGSRPWDRVIRVGAASAGGGGGVHGCEGEGCEVVRVIGIVRVTGIW